MFRLRLVRTRATPIYSIGVVARLTGMPIWTLRWVERHGLVAPARTEGHQRLFSEEQLELLNAIRELMEEKVNLAGIRIILRMRTAAPPADDGRQAPARKARTGRRLAR